MIKLCLYLKHQSSQAYETLRQSGCLALPSQRTLRDYSNAVKSTVGFSKDIDKQLLQAAHLDASPEYHSLIVILIDEIHIKEELVYNKHSGRLIGFVDLGSVNNPLARFEEALSEDNEPDMPPLANSMVAFMVKGVVHKVPILVCPFPMRKSCWQTAFQSILGVSLPLGSNWIQSMRVIVFGIFLSCT